MEEGLVVSEKFYSMQGEGQTMGIPAVFIRLAGCNLLCKSDSWICDTIEVWRKGSFETFANILDPLFIKRLSQGAHLVLTGGEPLLYQKKLLEFLNYIDSTHSFKTIVEVETNGTILPEPGLIRRVDYWNVSPKLKTSGASDEKRTNELALRTIRDLGISACFKFVISCEEDVLEILETKGIDLRRVILMPAGATQDELNKTRPMVAELAVRLGFKYCDRLHVVIWNKKTGV